MIKCMFALQVGDRFEYLQPQQAYQELMKNWCD